MNCRDFYWIAAVVWWLLRVSRIVGDTLLMTGVARWRPTLDAMDGALGMEG